MANVFKIASTLTLDTRTFTTNMALAQRKAKQFGNDLKQGLRGVAEDLKGISGGIFGNIAAAAAGGLAIAYKAIGDMGHGIQDTVDQLGLGAQALTEFGYVARRAGIDEEAFTKGLEHLRDKIALASQGNKEAAQLFDELGLSASDLANIPLDQAFERTTDALSKVKNEYLQADKAGEILGVRNKQFLRIIKEGAAGLEAGRAAARRYGQTLSSDTVAAIDDTYIAAGTLKDALLNLFANAAAGSQEKLTLGFYKMSEAVSGLSDKIKAAPRLQAVFGDTAAVIFAVSAVSLLARGTAYLVGGLANLRGTASVAWKALRVLGTTCVWLGGRFGWLAEQIALVRAFGLAETIGLWTGNMAAFLRTSLGLGWIVEQLQLIKSFGFVAVIGTWISGIVGFIGAALGATFAFGAILLALGLIGIAIYACSDSAAAFIRKWELAKNVIDALYIGVVRTSSAIHNGFDYALTSIENAFLRLGETSTFVLGEIVKGMAAVSGSDAIKAVSSTLLQTSKDLGKRRDANNAGLAKKMAGRVQERQQTVDNHFKKWEDVDNKGQDAKSGDDKERIDRDKKLYQASKLDDAGGGVGSGKTEEQLGTMIDVLKQQLAEMRKGGGGGTRKLTPASVY